MLIQSLYNVVDLYFVAKLSEKALATSLSYPIAELASTIVSVILNNKVMKRYVEILPKLSYID